MEEVIVSDDEEEGPSPNLKSTPSPHRGATSPSPVTQSGHRGATSPSPVTQSGEHEYPDDFEDVDSDEVTQFILFLFCIFFIFIIHK